MKYELFDTMIAEFAEKEVRPFAAEIDEREEFPVSTLRKMATSGMLGIIIPPNFGGAGGDYRMYIKVVETLSHACATTGIMLSAHTSLCVAPILEFGTNAQKSKYLPMLAGGALGALGVTEPNAGSDVGGVQTTAVLKDDKWILNGNKIFITNAGYADVYIILAVTGMTPKGKECSIFIVEKSFKGFSVGKKELKHGIRGSATCELLFNDCEVPVENMLGAQGAGIKIALKTFDGGRIGVAAQALGIAQGAFDSTLRYVKERKQFSKPLAQFQNVQFMLADMDVQIAAARHLVYKAQETKDAGGQTLSVDAARAKLFASRTAVEVTDKCIQLYGGYGYMREYPVERMHRDAKVTEIYEGTSEVQKMVISAALLRGQKEIVR